MSKTLGVLGICKKAGKISAGADVTFEALEDYKARLVIFASDSSTKTTRRFMEICKVKGVPYLKIDATKEELGLAVSKSMCSVCAVLDLGLANSLASKLSKDDEENILVADKLELKMKRKQERLENQKDPNYVKKAVVKAEEVIDIEENAYNKRKRRDDKNTYGNEKPVKKQYKDAKPENFKKKYDGKFDKKTDKKFDGKFDKKNGKKFDGKFDKKTDKKFDGKFDKKTGKKFEGKFDKKNDKKFDGKFNKNSSQKTFKTSYKTVNNKTKNGGVQNEM